MPFALKKQKITPNFTSTELQPPRWGFPCSPLAPLAAGSQRTEFHSKGQQVCQRKRRNLSKTFRAKPALKAKKNGIGSLGTFRKLKQNASTRNQRNFTSFPETLKFYLSAENDR